MSQYVESKVRTSKLWCSACQIKIEKGQRAIFHLDGGKMDEVFCPKCGTVYLRELDDDDTHPFSDDAFHE